MDTESTSVVASILTDGVQSGLCFGKLIVTTVTCYVCLSFRLVEVDFAFFLKNLPYYSFIIRVNFFLIDTRYCSIIRKVIVRSIGDTTQTYILVRNAAVKSLVAFATLCCKLIELVVLDF
jgi:hypothetical protein